jgi:hypothetical protein
VRLSRPRKNLVTGCDFRLVQTAIEKCRKTGGHEMKAQLYRVASSRSFTRFLSIVAVAVVAFAALELLAVQPALAGIVCCTNSAKTDCLCDSSTVCNITRNGKFYGTRDGLRTCWNLNSYGSASQIKSEITCENVNGTGTTVLDPTSFTQTALLFCEVTNSSHSDTGFCQYDLKYSRSNPELRTCAPDGANSIATWQAFCSEATGGNPQLTVEGTLKCPATLQPPAPAGDCAISPGGCGLPLFCDAKADCILNLGIAEAQGKCSTLFPADAGLLAGQVLGFSQTVEGPGCGPDNEVLAFGSLDAVRYCTSGTFNNAPGDPVDCTPPGNQEPLTGLGLAQTSVQFDVTFNPPTLNINCGTNNNDTWHFTITANQHLTDLTRIVPASLAVEGVSGQVICDDVTPTATTRTCHINACQQNPDLQDLATVVCNTNPKGRADLTVTGLLDDPDPQNGIPIFGEDLGHKTTGQCRPLEAGG